MKVEGVCCDEAIEVRCIDLASPRVRIPACIVSISVAQSPLLEIIVGGAATKGGLDGVYSPKEWDKEKEKQSIVVPPKV